VEKIKENEQNTNTVLNYVNCKLIVIAMINNASAVKLQCTKLVSLTAFICKPVLVMRQNWERNRGLRCDILKPKVERNLNFINYILQKLPSFIDLKMPNSTNFISIMQFLVTAVVSVTCSLLEAAVQHVQS